MKSSNFNSTTVPPDITEYRITNNDNNFFIPEGLDISPKSMMSLIREIEAEQQLQQQQPQQQSQQQSQQQTQQQQVQQQQTVQAAQAAQATPTAAATISPQLQQKLHQQQQSNILLPQQQYSPNGFPQQHFPPQSLFHKEMNSIDDQLYYNDIESNNNTNTYTNKINSGISTYQSPSLNSMQTPYFTSTTSTNMSNMSNLNTFNNANGNSGHNNMNIPENTGSLFQSTNPSSDLNLNLDQSTINYQTTSLNNYKLSDILKLIPSLINHPDFKISKLERLLSIYWNFFHVRFPILHKPTFIAKNSPTLLLLAMIMLGAKLSNCVPDLSSSIEEKLINPKTLADQIANPLRWLLFSSPHFQPPAKSWIIQSLLILEFYEKNCSSRVLHERAHLHHGTTIQLLRRSPTLGGSPLKSSTADDANTSSTRGNNGGNTRSSGERLLQQWIEAER
ncbi:unnamed protein product [[Candida] boidinii]|nr:unnamed protein product [[Candida] boidinii]